MIHNPTHQPLPSVAVSDLDVDLVPELLAFDAVLHDGLDGFDLALRLQVALEVLLKVLSNTVKDYYQNRPPMA